MGKLKIIECITVNPKCKGVADDIDGLIFVNMGVEGDLFQAAGKCLKDIVLLFQNVEGGPMFESSSLVY